MAALGKVFRERDEYYTPPILSDMIVPFLEDFAIRSNKEPKKLRVLCPFDTEHSAFVHSLRGFDVTHSHIDQGKNQRDFFSYWSNEIREFDVVVSNPPFSKKLEIFQRLYEAEVPFAMLMNLMILNYEIVGRFFLNHPLQLLIPTRRVSFDGNQSSFNTAYFCFKFLGPRDVVFHDLPNNNAGKFFIGSPQLKQ